MEAILSLVITFAPFILILYFGILRPQKKQRQAMQTMLDGLQMGDKIVTIGGIIGKVVKIKEDEVVIETGVGAEKSTIKFQKNAISRVLTIHE
ncbi:MAG: preprotein translocase subunit YajC [Clostridia bacterium]|nr:preprotein translocase subunit YajC [Clostridia bacterium]